MARSSTIVGKAVADFLLHLREQNSSPHTIKAYSGDLANFSAYAGSRGWKQIDHIAIRGFLSQLYEKGLSKTSVARSLAAVRSLYKWLAQRGSRRAESGQTCSDAEAAEEASARSDDRRDEFGARWANAGSCRVSRARPAHARTAVWMRHPQLRAYGNQSRRYSPERGGDPDSRQREEGALRPVWWIGDERAGGLSSGAADDAGRDAKEHAAHC